MKKIIAFLIICFAFINCSALTYGGCDYSTVSRMKSIVSNINISYDYSIINGESYFNVTLNNLTRDIYFYDSFNRREYYYTDTNNGEITIYGYKDSVKYKFYSSNGACYGTYLGVKYANFPKYNIYYEDPLCSDIPNYSLCQKWANVNYSRTEFEKMVFEYKNKQEVEEEKIVIQYEKTFFDKIIELYINYYYYFLGGIIIVLLPIIIIYNKKNRFKL